MAPEQLLHGTQSASVDIFALGLTLWDLLTQTPRTRLPLHELSFNQKIAELLDQVRSNRYLRPLVPILSQMLDYHPHNRPDAREIEIFLLQIADELPGPNLTIFAKNHVLSHQKAIDHSIPLPEPTQSSNITINAFQATAEPPPSPPRKGRFSLPLVMGALIGTGLIALNVSSAPHKESSPSPQLTIAPINSTPVSPPSPKEPPAVTPPQASSISTATEIPSTKTTTAVSPPSNQNTPQPIQAEYMHELNIQSIPAGMLIKIDDPLLASLQFKAFQCHPEAVNSPLSTLNKVLRIHTA